LGRQEVAIFNWQDEQLNEAEPMKEGDKEFTNVLDTFDHVVVLMLENRSFDSLLGYLYSRNYPVPPGKQFDGVDGKNLSNPIPVGWQFKDENGALVTEVPVAPISDINDITFKIPSLPYPDPGEDYPHVNTQLFNSNKPTPYNQPPYNLPSPVPAPTMNGFVSDYIQNYLANEYPGLTSPPPPDAFYGQYKCIMQSYDPADLPVLSGLAREFAVFDHWFCSVPSETICNRNFWHAGTSWGHVINPGPADDPGDEDNHPNTDAWLEDTAGATLFSQLSTSPFDWKIYSDNKIPLTPTVNLSLPVTPLLHLLNFFPLYPFDSSDISGFKSDCANGKLPAYSFIEPNFFNPHNDMHPSTPGELGDGEQTISPVLLGDVLVWDVYHAIFTSPYHWDNTLLIITFDEHGGCYDHVSPPGRYGANEVIPEIATPPDLAGYTKWDGFAFDRLGLRVPTIMVSPYIKRNTIINASMSHTSFLRTMREKWGLSSLSARADASPSLRDCGLLCSTLQRQAMSDMPVFARPPVPADPTDYSKAVMSALAKAIVSLLEDLWRKAFGRWCPTADLWRWLFPRQIRTQGEAAAFLREAIHTAKIKLGRADAAQMNEDDGVLLLQAMAEELKKKIRAVT
jgi:phospholipase C